MAVDEALLECVTVPTMRFYGWQRPALSFGYFGRYSDVAAESTEREIVRRWTGGGIVLHGADLTYSIVVPGAEVAAVGSRAIYARVHRGIQQAVAANPGIMLAERDAPKRSEACFANPVVADVLLDGRKIAGAAQRRTRTGLLHQGSIQWDELPPEFPDAFAAALCADFKSETLPHPIVARAAEIAAGKYATREWLHRR